MKVGFIGLGKLGLPVALAVDAAGHDVYGWDTNEEICDLVEARGQLPYLEEGAQELMDRNKIRITPFHQMELFCDLLFIAVQTPHQPEYEGVTRVLDEKANFDYSYLQEAIRQVQDARCPLIVISTVLPGTIEQMCPEWLRHKILYNPFFIAMGTTIKDFRDPEFVLIGTDQVHPGPLREFYATIHDRPLFVTTIKTAELTKVAYNTFIGLKIAFGNSMMEICEKTGADVDDLVDALALAGDRIISPKYMRGGMGDGGGCHPRDNIALSWLARELDLSYDLFEALMVCRERQTEWLAGLAVSEGEPLTLLGKAYKPETNLTVGSPAILLSNILNEWGIAHEHEDSHV